MSLEVCFSGEVLVAEATEPLLDSILILHHGASHGFELFGVLATEEIQVSPLIQLFQFKKKLLLLIRLNRDPCGNFHYHMGQDVVISITTWASFKRVLQKGYLCQACSGINR